MRMIVCEGPLMLCVASREAPTAKPGEVLVRIRRVGLCGTDYHIYSGRHPFLDYPRVMGHELSGEVLACGEGVALSTGQIVAINPYLSCRQCGACRKGKPNACTQLQVLGVHVDGGMCDVLAVPARAIIDASGLTLDQAAMVEFLAIGAHAVARAPAGDRMLVVGTGPIGVATALFARLSGFDVLMTDRRQPRINFVQDRLGLRGVPADGRLDSVLSDDTAGDMFDVVVDATGSLSAMRKSLDYVAHGGALVLVGVALGDLSFVDSEFHKREAVLIASRNALEADFRRVIDAIGSRAIDTATLHTHSLDADELPTRLPELIAQADNVLKAIVAF